MDRYRLEHEEIEEAGGLTHSRWVVRDTKTGKVAGTFNTRNGAIAAVGRFERSASP